jgi:hypothetical protein
MGALFGAERQNDQVKQQRAPHRIDINDAVIRQELA